MDSSLESRRPPPRLEAVLRKQGCFLKGQVAENIVERLFDAHGYEILPYGVEKRFPGWLHDYEVERACDAYRQIRAAPDFIAKIPNPDGRGKRLLYIEVKFRATGHVDWHLLERYTGFHKAILVLVHPQGLSANLITQLVAGEPLVPAVELTELRLSQELVEHFERMVRQMYDWHWETDL